MRIAHPEVVAGQWKKGCSYGGGVRVVVVVEEVCFGVGGEMLLSQQIFRTRAESQRVAWQACSPAYNTLSHIQVVYKGFISANI